VQVRWPNLSSRLPVYSAIFAKYFFTSPLISGIRTAVQPIDPLASPIAPAFSRIGAFVREHRLLVVLLPAVFGLLWFELFSLPLSPVNPGLDPSWCGALIHFAALKLQFGRDVIFTYGPLAHLISFVYSGELFRVRVLWEFASKTIFAAILCASIVSLPKVWRPIFFLFVLLFIWIDPISDALYFLVFTCVAAALFRQGRFGLSMAILAGLLFGVCSLIKFTYFLLALSAIGAVGLFYLFERTPKRALGLVAAFLASLLLSWHLAGQAFGTLPLYLDNSLAISFGYKEAMGTPAASDWIVAAGAAALFLELIQCSLLVIDSPRLSTLCLALFFVCAGMLSWTRAFVRADDHVLSFFGFFPEAALLIWIRARPGPKIRHFGYGLNVAILAVCIAGMTLQRPAVLTEAIPDAISKMVRTWRVVTALPSTIDQLRTQLIEARSANDLPRVRAEVKNETIDVFGYEQGIALLNGLNYTPRPVFQGYSAYTAPLIAQNTAFYSSSSAPSYVLLKYQPIDERYPTLEDAGVLLQLLVNYTPLFDEHGYSLWKRVGAPHPITPTVIATKSLLIDEICEVPADKTVWLELEVPKSIRGRLRSILYKPPQVEIRTIDSDGHQFGRRLIPSMSASGFIVNPYLETPRNLLESAIGSAAPSTRSFLVDVSRESRRYFQRRISCRIATLPPWPSQRPAPQALKKLYRDLFGEQGREFELVQQFQSATPVLSVNRDTIGFADFRALNDCQLVIGADGLKIVASGTDSQILLPKISMDDGRRGILRLDIDVPQGTDLQLFYRPRGVSVYGHYHMDRFVRRGKNSIYFELSEADIAGGQLRLDPGMVAGNYLITNIEFRLLPPE
jgi:hypothetical protein